MSRHFILCALLLAATPAFAAGYEAQLDPAPFDATNRADVIGSIGNATATLDGSTLTVTGTFSNLKSPATTGSFRIGLAKGVPGGAIVLVGDEAGGGLAFAVALAVRNAGLDMPGGIAALSPWADLSLSGLSMLANRKADTVLDWETLFLAARNTLRKSNPCDAYASPAYANLAGFPPVMVHAGASEILRDDASKLGDRAADANVAVSVEIYDGMGHLFQMDQGRNEAKVSLSRLAQFVRARSAVLVA